MTAELLYKCSVEYDPRDINEYFRNVKKDSYTIKEEGLLIYMTVNNLWEDETLLGPVISAYKVKRPKSLEYTNNTRLLMFRLSYLINIHPEDKVEIAKLLMKVPGDILESVYINEYYYFDLPITSKILLDTKSPRLNYLIRKRSGVLKTVNEVNLFIKLTKRPDLVLPSLDHDLFINFSYLFNYVVDIYELRDIIDNVKDLDTLKYIIDRIKFNDAKGRIKLMFRQNIPSELRQHIRMVLSKYDIVFYSNRDEYKDYEVINYPYINVGNSYTISDLDRLKTNIYPDLLIYRLLDEMYSLTYRVNGDLISDYPVSENIVYYFLTLEKLQEFAYDQLHRILEQDTDYYRIHINNYQYMNKETTIRINEGLEITFIINDPVTPNFTDKEIIKQISPLMIQGMENNINYTYYFIL